MSAGDLTALRCAYALVCPQLCTGATQGPAGPPGPPGPPDLSTNAVGSFYSDQTQNISTNSTTIWSLNQSTFQRSVGIVASNRITVYQTGIYEVYYSAQIHRTTGGSNTLVYIWLSLNGNTVPETNGRININSNNGDSLPIVPYIIELNAGDYIQFIARTDEGADNHVQVLATTVPVGYGPSIPSLIVGIKRIG